MISHGIKVDSNLQMKSNISRKTEMKLTYWSIAFLVIITILNMEGSILIIKFVF